MNSKKRIVKNKDNEKAQKDFELWCLYYRLNNQPEAKEELKIILRNLGGRI